jgi:hypothetical protein
MDQGTAPDPAMWSLRSRGPAHAVSHRCLEVQRSASPRCFFGRLFGFDPLHPDAVAWYRGALGERRVGRILAGLGREWRVLHAVPQGDGDAAIDHLVIGPPGVFTLTSAAVIEAEAEARAASRSLTRAAGIPVGVTAIVVDAHAHAHAVGPAAQLVPANGLLRHLRELPTTLGPDIVASVARAAEEWTTWKPFAVDADHRDPVDAFERLHADVVGARVRRMLWLTAGAAALIAGVVAIASLLPS